MSIRKHRTALAAVALCAGFGAVTAGCASVAANPGHAAPASPAGTVSVSALGTASSAPSLTGTPQAQAAQAAQALLHAFDGLPGASVSTSPSAGPGSPPGGLLSAQWTVAAASGAAFAAAEARMPDWPTTGPAQPQVSADGQNSRTVQEIGDGTLAQQSVSITTLPLTADRSTLQVSVEVLWRPAKPAAERVPNSRELTVTEQLGSLPSSAPQTRTVTVTDAATIGRIAAEINALPTQPRFEPVFCPMISTRTLGGIVTLDFRDPAGGKILAEVQLTVKPTAVCGGWVEVSVGGVTQPRLDDAADPLLATRILALAGLPGTPSAAPSAAASG
jgi:hypothetical protein